MPETRASGAYLRKVAWTKIARHRMVKGRASPDDPTLALLGEGADADRWFRTAIDSLSRTRMRAELARTHLLYGEWLRRESRRVDARAELSVAHDQFASMGMEEFAKRAGSELRVTGEKVRPRIAEARDELTPQERQVAQLAREELSNPEIAARLFLSRRTVEWHLRHVFSKLEIRSRRQLGSALRTPGFELATDKSS